MFWSSSSSGADTGRRQEERALIRLKHTAKNRGPAERRTHLTNNKREQTCLVRDTKNEDCPGLKGFWGEAVPRGPEVTCATGLALSPPADFVLLDTSPPTAGGQPGDTPARVQNV